jgi:hypothetical protein
MSKLHSLSMGAAVVALVVAPIVGIGASASASPLNSLDDYSSAFALQSPRFQLSANNDGATTEPGEKTNFLESSPEHISSTIWAKWTAPATGTVDVDTKGSDPDTSLAAFTGASSISKATRLAWSDDADASHKWSRIPSLAVTKGKTYYFQIGSVSEIPSSPAVTGHINLSVVPSYTTPQNDSLGRAITETGSAFSMSSSSYGSTVEGFESYPGSGISPLGSIWYKWTPISTGSLNVDFSGSFLNAYGAIWEQGGAGHALTLAEVKITPNSGAPGVLTLPVLHPGSTYYFSLGTYDRTGAGRFDGMLTAKATETITGPYVSKVSHSSGSHRGGTKITITGHRLTAVDHVWFGSETALGKSLVHHGSTEITVVTPAAAAKGRVYVQLYSSTTGESSIINSASHYTYD